MDKKYYKFWNDWLDLCEEITTSTYKKVGDMKWDEILEEGRDKATFFTINSWMDKAIPPYHFYYERRLMEEKEAMVEFIPASKKEEVIYDVGDDIPKTLRWGPAGSATEKDGKFTIVYDDGRGEAIIDKKALTKKKNTGGAYYTTKIKDVPTNIFPKDGIDNLWSVHEYKMRDIS